MRESPSQSLGISLVSGWPEIQCTHSERNEVSVAMSRGKKNHVPSLGWIGNVYIYFYTIYSGWEFIF